MSHVVTSPEQAVRLTPSRRTRIAQRWRRHRFAYALIGPAILFMLAVHVIPTAAGVYLSFLQLNTFTFVDLFRAPWTGLQNYR